LSHCHTATCSHTNHSDPHWANALDALTTYTEREGHARVRAGHIEDGFKLGSFVSAQRARYARGDLDPERVAELEWFPGWVWSATGHRFITTLTVLDQYVTREGTACIPYGHVENGVHLGAWARRQRTAHARGVLPAWQVAALEERPGWEW
jgi:hypothetical protein